ncbi:MAG: hypothetical protein KDJ20_00290 [Hyphomicrobiales bacterium]|nr:hypothetical protein [Amphiplicatus sp.]MCC2102572.1 hypothetical protein [Hyphomicrobiales bacterium]MCC2107452.1 hypothetical protein [Hyphomicrobiales bacterium]
MHDRDFPPLLNEIADVIGVEATMKLVAGVAGSRVHIPARTPDGHWLPELIGREASDKLGKHFQVRRGGSYIKIPLGPKQMYAVARKEVLALRGKASLDKIAQMVGVSRTFVETTFRNNP